MTLEDELVSLDLATETTVGKFVFGLPAEGRVLVLVADSETQGELELALRSAYDPRP